MFFYVHSYTFWGNDPILTFAICFKGVELIQLGQVSHPSDEKLGSFYPDIHSIFLLG